MRVFATISAMGAGRCARHPPSAEPRLAPKRRARTWGTVQWNPRSRKARDLESWLLGSRPAEEASRPSRTGEATVLTLTEAVVACRTVVEGHSQSSKGGLADSAGDSDITEDFCFVRVGFLIVTRISAYPVHRFFSFGTVAAVPLIERQRGRACRNPGTPHPHLNLDNDSLRL